jgi:hypothetical protein
LVPFLFTVKTTYVIIDTNNNKKEIIMKEILAFVNDHVIWILILIIIVGEIVREWIEAYRGK